MKKKSYQVVLTIITATLLFTNCNTESTTGIAYLTGVYRAEQLTQLYDQTLIPKHEQFVEKSQLLIDKANQFTTNLTQDNYRELQQEWKNTAEIWKRCEVFDLAQANNSFIHYKIHRWPTDVTKIEEYITGTENLDAAFVAGKGSSVKGIAAIEYLLFTYDYSSFENQPRKLAYLNALILNLNSNTRELLAIWKADETAFKEGIENGISGMQNQLVNAIISALEETIQSKLANALGAKNGGVLDVSELEAFRSEHSLLLMKNTLASIKECFTEDINTDTSTSGFNNFLYQLGHESLVTEINNQFKICDVQIEKIQTNLEVALVQNTDNVIELKSTYIALLKLIKVDLAAALNTTLTFNDNDGD